MTSPYGNKVIEIDGTNMNAISMAANRLMPPQYDEFIKVLRGGDCSDATRKYWVDFYDFLLECAEDNVEANNYLAMLAKLFMGEE